MSASHWCLTTREGAPILKPTSSTTGGVHVALLQRVQMRVLRAPNRLRAAGLQDRGQAAQSAKKKTSGQPCGAPLRERGECQVGVTSIAEGCKCCMVCLLRTVQQESHRATMSHPAGEATSLMGPPTRTPRPPAAPRRNRERGGGAQRSGIAGGAHSSAACAEECAPLRKRACRKSAPSRASGPQSDFFPL